MNDQPSNHWKNKDAEYSTLGSCLRDNGCIGEVFQIVKPDDFWFPVCRIVAPIILELFLENKPVDLVILANRIKKDQRLDDAPPFALAEFWDAAPTAANAIYYAKIVAENALQRNMSAFFTESLRELHEGSVDPEEFLQKCESSIFQLAQRKYDQTTKTMAQALVAQADRFEGIISGKTHPGLATGFNELDDYTSGLHPEELTILAARPSIGKTALACQIIRNIALSGSAVYFATIEQPMHQITERMLCQEGRIHAQHLRNANLDREEYDRLAQAREMFYGLKVFFSDSHSQTVLQIATNARRHKLKDGISLVVVDYLQLITPENSKVSREEQVSEIARRLKNLARELQVPVLALCQLNRQSENRQDRKPKLSDLRESGGIEAHADTVLLLHRNGKGCEHIIDVLVEKNRNGPTGEVSLVYLAEHLLFRSAAEVYYG